jgi:hypothetical protein
MSKKRASPKSSSAWLVIIKEYLNSGLSKEIFCKDRQLDIVRFNVWHTRLNPKKNPLKSNQQAVSNFIPVKITSETPKMVPFGLQIELPNGIKLGLVDVNCNGHKLEKLLRACCNVVNR